MKNLLAIFNAFRRGGSLVDVVRGKQWGAFAGVCGTFIMALAQVARAFGLDLALTSEAAEQIGLGIAAAAGVFVTYATSNKVGLPGLPPMPAKPAPADPPAPDLSGAS